MKKILFAFALFVLASFLPDLVHATTNAARVKNWTAEKLYAADLNTEFDNLVNYLNNNIAFVTNITASATQINQLNGNRFTQASTFTAAVTCSSNVTITTGTLSAGTTNVTPPADGVGILGLRGKSLQSVAADSLIAEVSMTVAKFDTAGSGSNIVSKTMIVAHSVDSNKIGNVSPTNIVTKPIWTNYDASGTKEWICIRERLNQNTGIQDYSSWDATGSYSGTSLVFTGGFHTSVSERTMTQAATSAGDTDQNQTFMDTDGPLFRIKKTSGPAIATACYLQVTITGGSKDISSIQKAYAYVNISDANFTGSPSDIEVGFLNSTNGLVNPNSLFTADGNVFDFQIQGVLIK